MPSLVQLESLSLSVGSDTVVESACAHIVPGQRVCFVGKNGCGKSTLLRAIHDFSQPSGSSDAKYFVISGGSMTGSLRASSGALLVEQDDLHWSTLLGGIDEETLRELPLPDALDLAAAEDPSFVEDAEAWRRLFAAASDLLGWEAAGYDTTPLGMLSPGCGVRAYLAVALHRPDIELLLLDEPTNHMDIASVLWLKESLLASNKSAVLVSHDAAFMDGVCDHVWSFDSDSRHLTVSGASYSDFRRAEAIAREMQAAAYEAQQKRHRKLTAAADRLRSASEAGQFYFTKDRDKLLRDFKRDRSGRSGSKAKALDTLRDREPQIEAPVVHTPLHIDIEPLGGGSDATIILSSVLLKYPGREPLPLPPLSLRVDFGERVGIVGANGVGKSTVLRAITGQIAPCEGEARVGRELRIGNLMQEHENLCKDDTPAGYFSQLTGMSKLEAAKRLIRYGLTRQQVGCPIGELNPGARARLLLAGFAARKVNALVLDEPTNHLDEEAVVEVAASLRTFQGTAIVVSHNSNFIDSLQLTKLLRLSEAGLERLESMHDFENELEEAVSTVVAWSLG